MKKNPRAIVRSLLGVGLLLVLGAVLIGLPGDVTGQPAPDKDGPLQTFKGHSDAVFSLAFTPDGKFVITGSFDNTLKLWDAETGKEVRTFGGQPGHNKMVLCAAISPDGQHLASGAADNTLKLWDLPSSSPLKEYAADEAVNAVALSPDGKKLATALKDGTLKVWNTDDGKELFHLKGHAGPVKSVAFSANNAVIASSDETGVVRFWNAADGKEMAQIGAHAGPAHAVVINPNNATAHSVGQDGTLKFWALNTALPRPFPPQEQPILAVVLSPDGNQVLTTGADKMAKVSNFADGKQLRLLENVPAPVMAAAFNSNASQVAGGTQDGKLIVWNNADGKVMGQALAHEGAITGVSIRPQNDQALTSGADGLLKLWALPLPAEKSLEHPDEILTAVWKNDGSKVFTGSKDKIVRSWLMQNNQVEKQFTGHTAPVTALALSPNQQLLASGSEDATIRFWNQADGKETAQFGAHGGKVTALAFNAGNNQLASVGADGLVKLWQIPPVAPKSLAHPQEITSLVLTPDGARLITGCADKNVRIWNLSNGAQERAMGGHNQPFNTVAVSANGQMVAGGAGDNSFSVWKLGDGAVVKKIDTPAGVTAVALNPDGGIAAAGLANNLIQLFNVGEAKEEKQLTGHGGAISGLLYTSKGDQIISASADKTIRVWNVADGMAKTTLTHVGPVTGLALSKDDAHVAAGSGKTIKVWKLADGKEVASITTAGDVRSVAFAPKGDFVVVGESDNATRVYSLDGKLQQFFTHAGPVHAVAVHNDGKQIITAGADKNAHVLTSSLLWQQPHGAAVTQVVFDNKTNKVISAGADKTIKVWNAADGKEEKAIPAHEGAVVALAINGDSTKLVSAGADKTVKVWNPAAGDNKPLAAITVKGDPQSVSISPDGNRVAVAVAEEKAVMLRVFDAASGKELQAFDNHKGAVPALAFHPDNKTLLSASADKTARITGVAALAVIEAHAGGATRVEFHNSGAQAISAGADKTVKHWDLAKGTAIRTFGPVEEPVQFATFSKDFAQVGAASGKTVRIWNLGDGNETAKFEAPAKVTSLSFNGDKSRIVTSSEDRKARIWEVASKKELEFFPQEEAAGTAIFHNNNTHVVLGSGKTVLVGMLGIQRLVSASDQPLLAIATTPNGSHALTGGADKSVKMWNVGNGNAERTFEGAQANIQAIAVSPNNQQVAIGGADKMLRVYNFADAKEIKATQLEGEIQSLRYSPNNQILVGALAKNTVLAWDSTFTPGQPVPEAFLKTVQIFPHGEQPTDVVLAPDNATLYTASADKTVKVWRLAAPTPKNNLPHPGNVLAVVFSPDGKFFASAATDGKVRIFDMEKKTQVKEINAHPTKDLTQVYALAFSPDSKQLASAGMDRDVKIWDVPGGNLVREIKAYKDKDAPDGHKDTVFTLAFSPDGKTLATGSGGIERVIKLWNVGDGKLIRTLDNPKIDKGKFRQEPQSHPGWIYGLRFTKDGKHLISSGNAPANKGYLGVWKVADGTLASSQELPLGVFYGLALSPDETKIAVGAGYLGKAAPEFNSAYLLKLPALP